MSWTQLIRWKWHNHRHTYNWINWLLIPDHNLYRLSSLISGQVCISVWKMLTFVWFCDPIDYTVHWIPQAKTLEWVAFPLQETFPTQRLNPHLLHCRQILYQLSHKGSPIILEWVACPFSRGSSWPRNQTRVSSTAGGLFTNGAISSSQFSHSDRFNSLQPYGLQHSRPPCPSPTPRACSNSYP